MSDPLDRLRDGPVPDATVDVGAIKARARRITRRREMGLGAAAVAVVIIAGIGFLRGPITDVTSRNAAQERLATASPSAGTTTAGKAAGERSDTKNAITDQAAAEESAREEEREGGSTSAAAPGSALTGGAPELEATLAVEDATVGRGSKFTLNVCNRSTTTVTRSFGSAQRYDFIVQQGEEVTWRWSDDRFFAQVTGDERWKPEECKSWTEEWDAMTSSGAPAAPGSYEAIGILTSSPDQRTDPAVFCVDIC